MAMVVTNTGKRRISMLFFMLLFLLTVVITCTAFVRALDLSNDAPAQELKPLKEKEKIMQVLAQYSRALIQYDLAHRNNDPGVNGYAANCTKLSQKVHGDLIGKDTAVFYKDILFMLQMADQYLFFLDEARKNAADADKNFQQQLDALKQEKSALEAEKTILITEKKVLESDNNGLKSQIEQLKLFLAQKTSGGGSSAGADNNAKCLQAIQDVTALKTKYVKFEGQVQLLLGSLTAKIEDIKSAPLANNNKRKEELISEIEKFGDQMKGQND